MTDSGRPPEAQAVLLPELSTSPLSAAQILGDTIYVSGQVGRDPRTGTVPPEFAEQVHLAMANLRRVMEAAGGSLATVVKTTVFLPRREDFAAMNELYAGYFPTSQPARSTLVVGLARPDLLFEIEAVGYRLRPAS